jgi:hypothetical protein
MIGGKMRNEKMDNDPELAYNEKFGFYYFKGSDKVAEAFVAESQKNQPVSLAMVDL